MKVILLQDIKSMGKKGDVVEVNDGYARNFLIPKKMVVEGTKNALNEHNQRMANEAKRLAEEKAAALAFCAEINGKEIDVPVKCNGDKMYGSVTAQDVADALSKLGYTVDKKKITLHETIKTLGVYSADVWCYKETVAKIKINVKSI